jgi:hypothetical protein
MIDETIGGRPMLHVVKFEDAADMIVDADDGDDVLRVLVANGVDATPVLIREMPCGVFCAEVVWATSGDDEEDNPANLSAEGVVLEPLESLGDFLEIEAHATSGATDEGEESTL